MSIEKERLLSLAEYAQQQSARLRVKPASTITQHNEKARGTIPEPDKPSHSSFSTIAWFRN
jgi:hypothetical protein